MQTRAWWNGLPALSRLSRPYRRTRCSMSRRTRRWDSACFADPTPRRVAAFRLRSAGTPCVPGHNDCLPRTWADRRSERTHRLAENGSLARSRWAPQPCGWKVRSPEREQSFRVLFSSSSPLRSLRCRRPKRRRRRRVLPEEEEPHLVEHQWYKRRRRWPRGSSASSWATRPAGRRFRALMYRRHRLLAGLAR